MFQFLANRFPDVTWNGPRDKKRIAITIDDSPTENTAEILKLLKEHNIKATFFVIGSYADRRKEELKSIHEGGHEIGNHGWDNSAAWRMNSLSIKNSILATTGIINKILGKDLKLKWYRPGSGWFHKAMLEVAKNQGLKTALGDTYSYDPWLPFPKWNYFYLSRMVGNGSIIVIHDRPWTIELLKNLLPFLNQNGFECCTLSELFEK